MGGLIATAKRGGARWHDERIGETNRSPALPSGGTALEIDGRTGRDAEPKDQRGVRAFHGGGVAAMAAARQTVAPRARLLCRAARRPMLYSKSGATTPA